jgi:LPXTG-motif cell wall-anchored protein
MARPWRLAAAGIIGAAALTGGVAHAGNYPPDEPAPTTIVAASGIRAPEAADPAALAATGSDTGVAVKVAAGAVAAGVGLVLVARRRRSAEA